MAIALTAAAINMAVALSCGAVIEKRLIKVTKTRVLVP